MTLPVWGQHNLPARSSVQDVKLSLLSANVGNGWVHHSTRHDKTKNPPIRAMAKHCESLVMETGRHLVWNVWQKRVSAEDARPILLTRTIKIDTVIYLLT